jgi:hypothetical protein
MRVRRRGICLRDSGSVVQAYSGGWSVASFIGTGAAALEAK